MFLNIDLKGTEWVAINWFAQDPVGCKEIIDGVDQHALNQERFKLPNRTIAKIFVFRLIYGGTSYSYIYDPDFNGISNSARYWQRVIDSFYDKYKGIATQHAAWIGEAVATGQLVLATGRTYKFQPFQLPGGGLKWPRTRILNYPTQGLGHDITTIVRVSLYKRIKNQGGLNRNIKFVSTVHDSIVLDLPNAELQFVRDIVSSVFRDFSDNFYRLFVVKFNLPLIGELSVGNNLLDMERI